jgi:dipeptidyl aminopeptidase/acylaminoacyl peptidase
MMNEKDRLDGWGEIATYLDRSIRTAHRWNKEAGLPVHTIQRKGQRVVYALRGEIDAWLESGRTLRAKRNRSRSWVLTWAIAATLAAITGWISAAWIASSVPRDGGTYRLFGVNESDAAEFPLPRGLIAFHSKREGNYEIYLIDDDGTDERRITAHDARDMAPAISPDGTRIAFTSDRLDGAMHLFVMGIDGADVVRLSAGLDSTAIGGVHWHPSAEKLVFDSRVDAVHQLFEVRPDGTDLIQLTSDGYDSRSPRYSVDGKRIIYTRNTPFHAFTSEVFEKIGASRSLQLTFSEKNKALDEVVENGVPIILFAKRKLPENTHQLYRLLPSGAERPIFPEYNRCNEGGARAPRGPGAHLLLNEIVFYSDRAGDGTNLWRMHTDGSDARQITTAGGAAPDWWVPLPSSEQQFQR